MSDVYTEEPIVEEPIVEEYIEQVIEEPILISLEPIEEVDDNMVYTRIGTMRVAKCPRYKTELSYDGSILLVRIVDYLGNLLLKNDTINIVVGETLYTVDLVDGVAEIELVGDTGTYVVKTQYPCVCNNSLEVII